MRLIGLAVLNKRYRLTIGQLIDCLTVHTFFSLVNINSDIVHNTDFKLTDNN